MSLNPWILSSFRWKHPPTSTNENDIVLGGIRSHDGQCVRSPETSCLLLLSPLHLSIFSPPSFPLSIGQCAKTEVFNKRTLVVRWLTAEKCCQDRITSSIKKAKYFRRMKSRAEVLSRTNRPEAAFRLGPELVPRHDLQDNTTIKPHSPSYQPPPSLYRTTPCSHSVAETCLEEMATQPFLQNPGVLLISACAVAAFYNIYVLCISDGLLMYLFDASLQEPRKFPDTDVTMLLTFTGIKPVDYHLNNLITFWTPIIFRTDKALNLFTSYFMVQWFVIFALILLESRRQGNKGKYVGRYVNLVDSSGLTLSDLCHSFILFGSVVQMGGLGPIAPAYFILHLLTSPTASADLLRGWTDSVSLSASDIEVLPWSVTFGFIVPTIAWLLPTPSVISGSTMHVFQAIWQPFPVYMTIIQSQAKRLQPSGDKKGSTGSSVSSAYLPAISQVYQIIIALSALIHIPTILLLLLPPGVFAPFSAKLAEWATLSLVDVLVPPFPSLSWKMQSLAEGVHVFLLWDFYMTAVSSLIWAVALLHTAYLVNKEGIPWAAVGTKLVLWTAIGGPFAAATVILWERDTLLSRKIKA